MILILATGTPKWVPLFSSASGSVPSPFHHPRCRRRLQTTTTLLHDRRLLLLHLLHLLHPPHQH